MTFRQLLLFTSVDCQVFNQEDNKTKISHRFYCFQYYAIQTITGWVTNPNHYKPTQTRLNLFTQADGSIIFLHAVEGGEMIYMTSIFSLDI